MSTIWLQYLLFLFCWSFYFFIHSLLASNPFKNQVYQKFPGFKRYYRLVYNLLAFLLLLPLLGYTHSIHEPFLFKHVALNITGYGLFAGGIILMAVAFSSFNTKEFLGFEAYSEKPNQSVLVLSGLYKFVRHPLYFSTIILMLGIILISPTLHLILLSLVVFIYLVIGSRLEEKKLIEEFGEDYIEYRKKVKGLIPFVF